MGDMRLDERTGKVTHIGKFARDPKHDWYASPVRPELIDYSRRRADEQHKAGGRGFESKNRWAGALGELGVSAFLTALDVEHVLNGGVDNLPDLEVTGHGVAIKTTGMANPPRPEYWLPYPAFQLERHEFDDIIWCAYRYEPSTLWIVGGMSTRRFRAEAEHFPAGRRMESGEPAKHDFFRVRVSQVEPPIEFFCRLDVTEPGDES